MTYLATNPAILRGAISALAIFIAFGSAAAQEATSFQLSADEPVQIQADSLDVADAEGRATFDGNVEVVQGDLSLRASRMVVLYDNEGGGSGAVGGLGGAGNITRIDASGGVAVRSGEQVATGDEGSFDMATEIVTLTGDKVVLTDAGNVVEGCKMTIAMRTGNANVEPCSGGRVRLLLPGNDN